jgi:hypothetical protein
MPIHSPEAYRGPDWWCQSEFGETVEIIGGKTAEIAAIEAAGYFGGLAMWGSLSSFDVEVLDIHGSRTTWTVRRRDVWDATPTEVAS